MAIHSGEHIHLSVLPFRFDALFDVFVVLDQSP